MAGISRWIHKLRLRRGGPSAAPSALPAPKELPDARCLCGGPRRAPTHPPFTAPSQVLPCMVLSIIAKPGTTHFIVHRFLWALCVYLEAVSVFPQLRMMQNSKVVERFTAHYVFALGLSRFLSCAHWVLQIIDGDSFLLTAFFRGLWPMMVLLSEIVQTFILADFCYYYIKSYVSDDTGIVRLPSGVV